MRSLPTLALTAALGLAGLGLASAASAAPAEDGACSDTQGVTVVVQSGSTPKVGCAPGDPKTSGAALKDAGFSVKQVQGQDGVICQIDEAPTTSCAKMPGAKKYWAFHLAEPDGKWEFATKGAYQQDPKPGTVIGFRLGDGNAPGLAPSDATQKAAAQAAETSDSAAKDSGDRSDKNDDAESGSNALVPTAIGGGLLIVLGGGAYALARKRRN